MIFTIFYQQIEGHPFTVEVVDSVNDYLELMKELFDFESIKSIISGTGQAPLKVLINSMHGGRLSILLAVIGYINEIENFLDSSDWSVR